MILSIFLIVVGLDVIITSPPEYTTGFHFTYDCITGEIGLDALYPGWRGLEGICSHSVLVKVVGVAVLAFGILLMLRKGLQRRQAAGSTDAGAKGHPFHKNAGC